MNVKTLLPDLKNLVTELDEDLLARAQQDDKIDAGLREVFQQVEKGGRTAQAFEVWREDYLDQVAVAWVLACVFVRFMEDNHLIDECWLAGEKERRKLAEDTHKLFFRKHPHDTDREYFHHVFHEVGKIPAAKELFAEGKTPLWAVAPSGDAAMKLLAFWREIDPETGELKRKFLATDQHGKNTEGNKELSFSVFDPCSSVATRFLGDLYQELSEKAKKKYALCEQTLEDVIAEIGFGAVTREDEVYLVSKEVAHRHSVPPQYVRPLASGDEIRDWGILNPRGAIFPYDPATLTSRQVPEIEKFLWPWKTQLCIRFAFGLSQLQRGLKWTEYSMLFANRLRTPLSIAFASVATHNHFVLDRGVKAFKDTCPIIKFASDANEVDHLAVLGVLNSSTGCFWLKQVCHNKGSTVDQHGARQRTDPFEDFYQLNGTRVAEFPIPETKPLDLAQNLDTLSQRYAQLQPEGWLHKATPTAERLREARMQAEAIRAQMIALQEELDWQCYDLYGLLSHGSTQKEHGREYFDPESLSVFFRVDPWLKLGERAFEIVMARQMAKGELQTTWFERHGSTPITELPKNWPAAYRKLVERRIKLIETNKEIGLIERPEYKRRWNAEPWEEQEERALKNWLLDRLEDFSHGSTRTEHGKKDNQIHGPSSVFFRVDPWLTSVAHLADRASADAEFMQVAALYRGRADFDLAALVAELVEGESVPFLPILRYKPSGLRKRELWERTWELQRQEDLATDEHGKNTEKNKKEKEQEQGQDSDLSSSVFLPCSSVANIPAPPKYTSADFRKSDYWRLRGKLDVPKERWISYPHCQSVSDPTLVVGWAGWNHLEQATALVTYYDARKREGWDAKRLTPLLAGLVQLLPWIHQWHPEIDKEFGETAGKSYQSMLEQDSHELGLTLEEIRTWQPEKKMSHGSTRKKHGKKPT